MKPRDLKSPLSGNKKEVLIQDRVWYVPFNSEMTSFQFPGWVHESTFSVDRPVYVEYCSGNGAWIAAKAIQHPEINWVAVEKRFERARKIWSKIKNHGLDNLLVLSGEGFQATHLYFPSGSVQEAFVNFPDPWPKRRHGKHRIIQTRFIQEIERILKPQGSLTLVTDDIDTSLQMINTLQKSQLLESVHPDTYYVTDWPGYGTSYFEDLWREKGKEIRYHSFKKNSGKSGNQ